MISNTSIRLSSILVAILAGGSTLVARGAFVEFDDKSAWLDAVGPLTTIDFVSAGHGVVVTDQYEPLGVTFTDGDDTGINSVFHINDQHGLDGNGTITIDFSSPQRFIGLDFPGAMFIEVYSGDTLLYRSSDFAGPGTGHFAGILADESFDRVILDDWLGTSVSIDDLHFGVPGPSVLVVLAAAGLMCSHRRRL